MTDPMHDRCPALEPGTGERCVLYTKHISDRSGVHVATGSWPVEPAPVPPPVDALLDQVEARLRGHFHGIDGYAANGHAASAEDCTPCYEAAEVVTDMITEARAAGVEEGRRQQRADGPDAAMERLVGPVLVQVAAERMRQDARWGEQNHPDGTNLDNAGWRDHSRDLTEVAAEQGRVTWAHILQEEFVEALAEVEPARIRAELIQTAAVAVAWIQAIDRRQA